MGNRPVMIRAVLNDAARLQVGEAINASIDGRLMGIQARNKSGFKRALQAALPGRDVHVIYSEGIVPTLKAA